VAPFLTAKVLFLPAALAPFLAAISMRPLVSEIGFEKSMETPKTPLNSFG
jgi:hypothetical protein